MYANWLNDFVILTEMLLTAVGSVPFVTFKFIYATKIGIYH
jgi:hypothetical protein